MVTQALMDYTTWQKEKASWGLRCSRREGVIILKFDGLMEYIYSEMFPHSSIHLYFHSFLWDSSNLRAKLSGCRQVIILLHVLIYTTRWLYLPISPNNCNIQNQNVKGIWKCFVNWMWEMGEEAQFQSCGRVSQTRCLPARAWWHENSPSLNFG